MRLRIPEFVQTRVDKMGFPVPTRKWFAHNFYKPMQDLPTTRAVRERGICNVSAIVEDLQRHRSGPVGAVKELLT